ncbi:hypothetical protein GCM10014715_45340 [Streptomyces spiralis]|uniref:Uncharacterized protein n=1 Tax=Streptomyces spiralis TaxID=66376 RepID=A0A919A4C2_9ACTN|nr:hypothetical protein GCM10014715_45340 [Streptomyces spiralis]
MTCAFVPLMPKDEMPARRGRLSDSGHSRASVRSATLPADQSIWSERSSEWREGGSTPCRIAITILMMPATPAAACV